MFDTDYYTEKLPAISDGNQSKKALFAICGNNLAEGGVLTPDICAACKIKNQRNFELRFGSGAIVNLSCSGWDSPDIKLMARAYADPSTTLPKDTHALLMARPRTITGNFDELHSSMRPRSLYDPDWQPGGFFSSYPIAPCGISVRY